MGFGRERMKVRLRIIKSDSNCLDFRVMCFVG